MSFQETQKRTILKTILWRVIATLITWTVLFLYTGQIKESIKITLTAALAGMIAYYIYERIWNAIHWEKISIHD